MYNVFQHFYPYFDVVDVDWILEFEKALSRCFKDSSSEDHLITLQKFMASLQDGHIRVSSPKMATFVPPFSWEWIEQVYDQVDLTNIGDEVTQIDNQPAKDYFKKVDSKISAATKGWLDYRPILKVYLATKTVKSL